MHSKHTWLTCFVALCVVALSACPAQDNSASSNSGPSVTMKSAANETQPKYPIPRSERPYQDIHKGAKDAWSLVETTYFVVSDKYQRATKMLHSENASEREEGSLLRQEEGMEVENKIFTIHEEVEQGFLDAIEAEPDNPLNYATYAYFLKARKRQLPDGSGSVETEAEALRMIDKAIELWPDESSFYMVKVHILIEANRCHEWFRGSAGEEYVLYDRLPQLKELFANAEKYYPDNHWINYYYAIILARLTPPDKWEEVRREILREVRSGNDKEFGFFAFPPPLPPYPFDERKVSLMAASVEAQYVDHWIHFGHYDALGISMLVDGMTKDMTWPEDKEDIGEIMFFLWQVGRTLPFDRTAFGQQMKVLDAAHRKLDAGSAESKQLAQASRLLNESYQSVAQALYKKKLITDPTKVDVRGINELEKLGGRNAPLREAIQGPQAYYLFRCQEILGLEFPLPTNPAFWE